MGLVGGCGGGGSTSDSSAATFMPGVYRTINNCGAMANGTLIDDSDNLYQVCGTKLSVGKLSGTITSSATGNGSVKFNVFDSGSPAVSTSATFSGALLISNNYVVDINFTDTPGQPGAVAFDSKWVGASPVGSIMASYSTLSGNYVSYVPEKLAVDPTENISISTSGVISGTTSLGSVMGQITKFNSATGVHDVSITLTPLSGPPVVLAGVIGPYDVNMTGSALYTNYFGLLLAVSGNGAGFYRIFSHL